MPVRKRPSSASASRNVRARLVPPVQDPWDGSDSTACRQIGLKYWKSQTATDGSMTGISAKNRVPDVLHSRQFLQHLLRRGRQGGPRFSPKTALDCGAGVGRVTDRVLLKIPGVQRVDLIEPSSNLRREARTRLAKRRGVGRFFAQPLQDFVSPSVHDLIWVQWVLMYIPDTDVIGFLSRCRLRLAGRGCVVVKDNVRESVVKEMLDPNDASGTRTTKHFEAIFKAAGFRIVLKRKQRDWPKELYPMMMWALEPFER